MEHELRTMCLEFGVEHTFDGVHLNEAGVHVAAAQLAAFILKDKQHAHPSDLS